MSSLLRALFNGTSKHKKLSEEWATIREPVVEGMTFYCKYLGSTLVADPKGEAATAEAIKRIIHTAKQLARKPERVALHVSLKGIRMEDTATKEVLIQTSIYKISYCSADAHYDHVFAFIATTDNDTCECHAFLCPKRKMAQAVTISIAQAFNLAYECWKMSLENKDNNETFGQEELPAEVTVGSASVQALVKSTQSQPSSQASSPIPIRSDFGSSNMSTSGYQSTSQALLIDLDDSSDDHNHSASASNTTPSSKIAALPKALNDLDDLDDISDGFSRLALRRGNPPQPLNGTGTTLPLALDDLGLAAFTAPQAASPTESGSWPSSSPSQASSPLASSPPDPWEMSRSPNTAFLYSCQSPPPYSVFFSGYQSPPNHSHPSVNLFQSPHDVSSPPDPSHYIPTTSHYHPPSDSQSGTSLPHSVNFDSFPNLSSPPQLASSLPHQGTNHNPFQFPVHSKQEEINPQNQTGRDNPFLPYTSPTNPFLQSPVKEAPSVSSQPSSTPGECPVVVVAGVGGSGCTPNRPMWNASLFSGSKSKDVVCS